MRPEPGSPTRRKSPCSAWPGGRRGCPESSRCPSGSDGYRNPGDPGTLLKRGEARKEAGDLPGALADCNRALELAPPEQRAFAYHCRGSVRVLLGQFTEAIADYDQALALEPDNVCFYISRGHARYHRREARSLVDYRVALRLDRNAALREIVRLVLDQARRDAAAVLENCSKHPQGNAGDGLSHYRIGITLLYLRRDAEAEVHFARGRELLSSPADLVEEMIAVAREARDALTTSPR